MKIVKSMFTTSMKFPFWWIFKSPQRKLGLHTLFSDVWGLLMIGFRLVFPQKKLSRVTICIGVYNRSEMLLKHLLPSLSKCSNNELIELSIFDCGSTDNLYLENEIRKNFSGALIFRSEPMPFSRSKVLNLAVSQAKTDLVFICDADFSLPTNLVQTLNNYVKKGQIWFPIVFYLYKNKPAVVSRTNGEWMLWGGKGILGIYKSDFEACGKLDESFTTWGGEDEAFWLKCHSQRKTILRTKEKGLIHHWHPSLNPKYKLLEELADKGIL